MAGALRTAVGLLTDAAMLPLRQAYIGYLRRQSPKTSYDGIVISTWYSQGDHSVLSGKVGRALDLIHRADRRRYNRLLTDVGRITIERLQVAGLFAPKAGGVFLDARHIEQAHVAELALTIVHEATHARIHRAGITADVHTRGRIENLCITSEIDFASKLGPDYHSLIEAAEQKRRNASWSETDRFDRRVRQLEEAGLPGWFVRAYARVFHP